MKTIFAIILTILIPAAQAKTIWIECVKTSSPIVKPKSIYKSPPKDFHKSLSNDLFDLFVIFPEPPTIWQIDTQEQKISPARSGTGVFVFKQANIETGSISATTTSQDGAYSYWQLNRVSGELRYERAFGDEIISEWRKKHNGTLPKLWVWEFLCIPTTPAI